MKKTLLVTLLLTLLFALCACGEADPKPEPTPVESPVVTAGKPAVSDDEQKKLIMDNYELWKYKDGFGEWYYTVCDLDRNGRLELITAGVDGSACFTYADFWEVSADGKSLERCDTGSIDGTQWPDLIVPEGDCYFDGERYYYALDDLIKLGISSNGYSRMWLSLDGGKLSTGLIATRLGEFGADGSAKYSYSDAEGREISEAEFESAVAEHFKDMEKTEFKLDWTSVKY